MYNDSIPLTNILGQTARLPQQLHTRTSAVEELPHCRRGQVAMLAQEVGQLAAERHDDRHHQVRQRRHDAALGDLEAEGVVEVLGLHDDEQVEAPAAREVRHDDRPHRRRQEEALPRCLEELQQQMAADSSSCEYIMPVKHLKCV